MISLRPLKCTSRKLSTKICIAIQVVNTISEISKLSWPQTCERIQTSLNLMFEIYKHIIYRNIIITETLDHACHISYLSS
jgi:hypothetical protein